MNPEKIINIPSFISSIAIGGISKRLNFAIGCSLVLSVIEQLATTETVSLDLEFKTVKFVRLFCFFITIIKKKEEKR